MRLKSAKNKSRWLCGTWCAAAVLGMLQWLNVESVNAFSARGRHFAVLNGIRSTAGKRTAVFPDLILPDLPGILPSRYSSVDCGRKPTVKSQGSYGTCWALAATSALESALLPEQRIVFSADHLALNNAFTVPVNDGGDARMTMAYLNGWQGPVTEEEDPYGDGYSPSNLSPAVHVQEIQLLDGADRQEIKEAVQK